MSAESTIADEIYVLEYDVQKFKRWLLAAECDNHRGRNAGMIEELKKRIDLLQKNIELKKERARLVLADLHEIWVDKNMNKSSSINELLKD